MVANRGGVRRNLPSGDCYTPTTHTYEDGVGPALVPMLPRDTWVILKQAPGRTSSCRACCIWGPLLNLKLLEHRRTQQYTATMGKKKI